METPGPVPSLRVQLLGPLSIARDGGALRLPASRKVRALFGYLAVAPRAVTRSQLCELLWDVPNDPRGELRWCLSKIRGLVDESKTKRVQTHEDTVGLDLSDCAVDAIEIARATEGGVNTLAQDTMRGLSTLWSGEFLEGLELDGSASFQAWLSGQRRRFRDARVAVLSQLGQQLEGAQALEYLEKWRELAPFDGRVHELLLAALTREGRVREAEEHFAAISRAFAAEGLDVARLREAWQRTRSAPPAAASTSISISDRPAAVSDSAGPPVMRRASIAVMPFADPSTPVADRGGIADALVEDVITGLAQLRSLFVIARGTVFALHERRISPSDAGRMLNVDYVLSGSVRRLGERLRVSVELSETATARIVWADTLEQKLDDAYLVLAAIGNRIVASIATEIETSERNRAILRPPSLLNAWEAHHRGLWHMYRFNQEDNARAAHFFKLAIELDPTFSRAYSGLSFTHFQNAFQGWMEREPEVDRAYEAAGQSVMIDDRDPAARWAMGRALWLRGRHEQSVVELERAVELSPNFALGHYTLAFVNSQAGDAAAAISSSDQSQKLSPFDPLLFGMFGARAMALVRLGRYEDASRWAVRAAALPNAHPHILAIATYSLALAGSLEQAREHAAALRKKMPAYSIGDFLAAFRLDAQGTALFREGAGRL